MDLFIHWFVMVSIDSSFLHKLAPKLVHHARQDFIIVEMARALPEALSYAGITTGLRVAHFLSQCAHESDGFFTVCEYASGRAYEGRKDLGNVCPGDGVRFKGRGLIQLTGRKNYQRFTQFWCSVNEQAVDCEAFPEMVERFPAALWSAIWFWQMKGLNRLADQDDVVRITKAINGGKNGLMQRLTYLNRAKKLLGLGDEVGV
ncbi:glycoside hydrolase family 19 protein [Bartonella vinsonii]|uniref:Peptidoglycan binding protein n=1 Tax=Bartonella vinsonii subsp. berkhoffii str. Tweed TaxID=1094502 RepID=N6UT72_BARVB|nr:peptidoglycan-binding protein [Bartonella vinsonii]ENN93149.1 peptidoglycan binding protein [Bartonella vinsonii subsp. berkhoffii str. Tweed]ENN94065.1 peptidoglycan binding protein [Bartonella vinsonii subsp. berkhoffii str. Tweed]ENN94799.1 peptidoglycan binding protein [Bartonella vinsonii subsp. berkhoffii str. Tweed]ENN95514.1 peptidoglycan binding protein [Bartonella vinsonii subsp. berkhoffii str. Tweed]